MYINAQYIKELSNMNNTVFDVFIMVSLTASFLFGPEIKYISLVVFCLIGVIRLGVIVYNLFTGNDKNKKI